MDWGSLLSGYPVLQGVFSVIILGLMAIYTWASVSFGLRFSNLTHRGVITNGPYRFSKHPAYLSKNLSWWFEAMPFIAPFVFGFRGAGWSGHWAGAAAHTLRLLGVNLIYYIRARTEERHLSHDPLYVRYALWMERHGMMAWTRHVLRFARYRPPAPRGDETVEGDGSDPRP
jgi:protein-S-isoprenylcysteine O-methyltransferase Ste14